jgi:hypothetical protein
MVVASKTPQEQNQMRTMPTHSGFTQDAIVLMTTGEESNVRMIAKRIAGCPDEEAGEMLRSDTFAALTPLMKTLPAFVQQIVARAILEEVDWTAVAARVKCPPEMN